MPNSILIFKSETSRLEGAIQEKALVVNPHGLIDQNLDLSSLVWTALKLIPSINKIVVDMHRVTGVNASGINRWAAAFTELSRRLPITYTGLVEPFIEFANVSNRIFGGHYTVTSFEAPFYCHSCKQEKTVSLSTKEVSVSPRSVIIPTLNCSHCHSQLVFSGNEASYFRFLIRSPTQMSHPCQ